jgi:hypothetical protein
MRNASQPPFETSRHGDQIAVRRAPAGVASMVRRESVSTGALLGGSVAGPDLTPSPAGGSVNMPILEACTVIGIIAEVVAVVVIAREVAVRAEEVSTKALASIVIAGKAVVSIVVAAKAGAVRFGPAETARTRTSEPSHGAAPGMFATKSAAHVPTAESTAQSATPESAAAFMTAAAASESATASMTAATTTATESSASSMTATATTSGGHGVRPRSCTERDGDEEDHDLARDWLLLLLYAGR